MEDRQKICGILSDETAIYVFIICIETESWIHNYLPVTCSIWLIIAYRKHIVIIQMSEDRYSSFKTKKIHNCTDTSNHFIIFFYKFDRYRHNENMGIILDSSSGTNFLWNQALWPYLVNVEGCASSNFTSLFEIRLGGVPWKRHILCLSLCQFL